MGSIICITTEQKHLWIASLAPSLDTTIENSLLSRNGTQGPAWRVTCLTMEQEEWGTQIARTVGTEVRRHRKELRLSAEKLAARCRELGHEIPRSVLTNLENGHRASIAVAELLVLGKALDIPPLLLVFPVGYVNETEFAPGQHADPLDARDWAAGYLGGSPDVFAVIAGNQPGDKQTGAIQRYRHALMPVHMNNQHQRLTSELKNAIRDVVEAEAAVSEGTTDVERLVEHRKRAVMLGQTLYDTRETMVERGLVLPTLSAELLQYVDEPGADGQAWAQFIYDGPTSDR